MMIPLLISNNESFVWTGDSKVKTNNYPSVLLRGLNLIKCLGAMFKLRQRKLHILEGNVI